MLNGLVYKNITLDDFLKKLNNLKIMLQELYIIEINIKIYNDILIFRNNLLEVIYNYNEIIEEIFIKSGIE